MRLFSVRGPEHSQECRGVLKLNVHGSVFIELLQCFILTIEYVMFHMIPHEGVVMMRWLKLSTISATIKYVMCYWLHAVFPRKIEKL